MTRINSRYDEFTQEQLFEIFRKAGYNQCMIDSLKRDILLSREEEKCFKVKANTPLLKTILNDLGVSICDTM